MANPIDIIATKDTIARLEALAARIKDRDRLRRDILAVLNREAIRAAGKISRGMRAGGVVRRRTGNLARSIVGKGDTINGLPGMRIGVFTGPAVAYAAAQELGATVKPKRAGGYLAVPTDDGGALTPAGVPRYRSAREYPKPLRFVRGRFKADVNGAVLTGGAALFTEDQVKRAERRVWRSVDVPEIRGFALHALLSQIRPVYLLLRKVKIKPKLFLKRGLEDALPSVVAEIERLLLEAVNAGV